MKKLGKLFSLLIIFSLILFISRFYLGPSFPYTHDGENHLARFANYKIAVRELQIPPRIAPGLHNHYGYPVFNYNYPLANILSLPFSFLKVSYQTTFALLVVAGLSFGAVGMYRWLGSFTKQERVKVLAVGIWLLQPYLVSLLAYRGNIGEVLAYSLLPWMFVLVHAVSKIMKTVQWIGWILLVASFALSHNITVVFAVPIVTVYAGVVLGREYGAWKRLISVGFAAVGLTLWFWLPALLEMSFTIVGESQNQLAFADHFVTIRELLWSSQQFGYSFPGGIDSLGLKTGFLSVVLVVAQLGLAGFAMVKRKSFKEFQLVIVLALLSLIFIFLQLPVSQPIWHTVSVLRFMQFPWRWALFYSVVSIPVMAFFISRMPKQVVTVTCGMVLVAVIAVGKLSPVDSFSKTNQDYEAFTQTTSTQNENMAKDFTYGAIGDWKPSAAVLEDGSDTTITTSVWSGREHIYTVATTQRITIVEPVMYFPGWETSVNGERVEYTDSEAIKGRLAYTLELGDYAVQTEFTQNTPARLIGNTFFFITLGGVLFVWFTKRKTTV